MSFWENISQLHIELSALCNAVCPSCRRYPVNGYEELPSINNSQVWTLAEVKQRFPVDDIKHIKEFLVNGNYGDFVTNHESIDILEYLGQSAPNSRTVVSTNGSARTTGWWNELATRCPTLIVDFCLDGLEDTHVLYRRQTDWNTIIRNAKEFMSAGGKATWVMTIFEHNHHQVDACEKLSKELGFFRFIARYNSRDELLARDRKGDTSYWIKDAPSVEKHQRVSRDPFGFPMKNFNQAEFNELQNKRWKEIEQDKFKANQRLPVSFAEKPRCGSLSHNGGTNHSIYVSARWLVSPCCHISGNLEMGNLSSYIDELDGLMQASDTSLSKMTATNDATVRDIVNNGFGWVYDKMDTTPASICSYTCGPKGKFASSFYNRRIVPIVTS
jgi:hypothetical protein